MSSSVTHVRRNILERHGKEKLHKEAGLEYMANTFHVIRYMLFHHENHKECVKTNRLSFAWEKQK